MRSRLRCRSKFLETQETAILPCNLTIYNVDRLLSCYNRGEDAKTVINSLSVSWDAYWRETRLMKTKEGIYSVSSVSKGFREVSTSWPGLGLLPSIGTEKV